MNTRDIAYALARVTYGLIFLFYGISKFVMGVGTFVGNMNQQFSGKLPAFMVMPFAYVLPFGEMIAGAFILLGLYTRAGLVLSGLLLIGLTFGVVMLGRADGVAHNLIFVLVNFVLLWFMDFNRWSADAMFARKTAVGFTKPDQ